MSRSNMVYVGGSEFVPQHCQLFLIGRKVIKPFTTVIPLRKATLSGQIDLLLA